MSVAKMKAAVKAAFANPLSELKKLAIAEANGDEIDQEHLARTLERAFLPPECHTANTQRIRRLKERQEARQQLTAAIAARPAAQQRVQAAAAEFHPVAQALEREFQQKLAELQRPLNEAKAEAKRLDDMARDAQSTITGITEYCRPNQDMIDEATRVGQQSTTLAGQIRELERTITTAETARRNLLLPGVRLTEAERTRALGDIAEAEAAAVEARQRIPEIQEQIQEVNRRSAEIRERAFEPANFQLSEPGDSDVKKLMPQPAPRKPEYEVMMFS